MKQGILIALVLTILYLLFSRRASGLTCQCTMPFFKFDASQPPTTRCVGPGGVRMPEVNCS